MDTLHTDIHNKESNKNIEGIKDIESKKARKPTITQPNDIEKPQPEVTCCECEHKCVCSDPISAAKPECVCCALKEDSLEFPRSASEVYKSESTKDQEFVKQQTMFNKEREAMRNS